MTKALKTVLIASIVVALMAIGGPAARADHMEDEHQGHHQHAEFGIFVGSMTFDQVMDADNGPLFGIRGGYDWSLHWGVEMVAAWNQSNRDTNSLQNRDHEVVAGSLVYSFRYDGDQVVVPYVGAGIGAMRQDKDDEGNQNELLLHAIAGLRFRAAKHVALMIDAREWFAPFYTPYRGKDDQANNESLQFHFAYRF